MAEIDYSAGVGQFVFFVFPNDNGTNPGALKRELQELLPMVSVGSIQEESCRLLWFSWARELGLERVKQALISLQKNHTGFEIRFSTSPVLTV